MGILKRLFHRHKLIPFKHCDKHLVAAYCDKCGCVKVGNPVYYDGTYYQRTLHGKDAIDFINQDLDYINGRLEQRELISKQIQEDGLQYKGGFESFLNREMGVCNNYETPEKLKEIRNRINTLCGGDFAF